MKPMAAFTHLAVANVASIDFSSGSGVTNADNQFRGDKPIELVIHSSYGFGADVTMQMMLFRTRAHEKLICLPALTAFAVTYVKFCRSDCGDYYDRFIKHQK